MKTIQVETHYGIATYHIKQDAELFIFYIKYPNEPEECQFLVSDKFSPDQFDALVKIHSIGYCQGRYKGFWENVKQLNSMINGRD